MACACACPQIQSVLYILRIDDVPAIQVRPNEGLEHALRNPCDCWHASDLVMGSTGMACIMSNMWPERLTCRDPPIFLKKA